MVYKYYSPTEYNFDALSKGYFFFSKVYKLNDPFDCSFKLIEQSKKFLQHLGFINREKEASDIMKQYGTCSFSRLKGNKRMWALYANNYQGFCVEFDDKQFDTPRIISWENETPIITENKTNKEDSPYHYMIKGDIGYVQKELDFDDFAICGYRELLNDDSIIEYPIGSCLHDDKMKDILFVRLCFTKEKHSWESEEEFRLLVGNYIDFMPTSLKKITDAGYKILFHKSIVSSITIGHNFSISNLKFLIDMIEQYPDTPIYITVPGKVWNIEHRFINKKQLIDLYDKIRCFENKLITDYI